MAVRYSFRDVDNFLLSEQTRWEQQAETLASRLSTMSDTDPHRATITALWQDQERIIDVIGMLRIRFRDYDRHHQYDASHDMRGACKP